MRNGVFCIVNLSYPQPFADPNPPEYYECGICGYLHPINWDGDCRDDNNRFTFDDLDEKYGSNNKWIEVPMPGIDEYEENEKYE